MHLDALTHCFLFLAGPSAYDHRIEMPLLCLQTRQTDENASALHISQTKLPRTEKRRESSHESRVRYSGGVNHRGAGVRLIGLEDSGLVPV